MIGLRRTCYALIDESQKAGPQGGKLASVGAAGVCLCDGHPVPFDTYSNQPHSSVRARGVNTTLLPEGSASVIWFNLLIS